MLRSYPFLHSSVHFIGEEWDSNLILKLALERSVSVNHQLQQFRSTPLAVLIEIGGDDGIRTHDPLLAGQVLSQLSYTPEKSEE